LVKQVHVEHIKKLNEEQAKVVACSSRDKKNLSRAINSMKFPTYQLCSMIGTTKTERKENADEKHDDWSELYELYVSNVFLPGGNLAPM
jgi:hypothetical protein